MNFSKLNEGRLERNGVESADNYKRSTTTRTVPSSSVLVLNILCEAHEGRLLD